MRRIVLTGSDETSVPGRLAGFPRPGGRPEKTVSLDILHALTKDSPRKRKGRNTHPARPGAGASSDLGSEIHGGTAMMILERGGINIVGRFLKTARPRNEWIDDVDDPEAIIKKLKEENVRADLFTFWQRYPDIEPRFSYHREWDNWAVLPVTSYENWLLHQINNKMRAKVRKAPKMGVEVRIVRLDEDFIAGVTKIFNETPFRQGKRFAHYGKSFQQVKNEPNTESARTDFIGVFSRGN